MTNIEKPVVVLVHGAWHQPLHYRRLIDALRAEGQTVLAPPPASAGYDDSIEGKSHTDDMRRIHETMLPYLDKGRTAVIVAHSYGGIPAAAAVEGHTVVERKTRGLPGGVISMVHIATLPAIQTGISLYEAAENQWLTVRFHDVDAFDLPLKMEAAKYAFYNDIENGLKNELGSYLCRQSRTPFEDPIRYVASQIEVPKTYVLCKRDEAIPLAGQEFAATMMKARTVELDCGHSPFVKPAETKELVKLILEATTQ